MLSELVALVPTTDPVRARAFYAGTLGLALEDENPFALVFRVAGTMLRVTVGRGAQPAAVHGARLGRWPTSTAAIDTLSQRGVGFERYDGMEQDGRGVWSAPSGARIAWFKDPDGNVLSLTQFTA